MNNTNFLNGPRYLLLRSIGIENRNMSFCRICKKYTKYVYLNGSNRYTCSNHGSIINCLICDNDYSPKDNIDRCCKCGEIKCSKCSKIISCGSCGKRSCEECQFIVGGFCRMCNWLHRMHMQVTDPIDVPIDGPIYEIAINYDGEGNQYIQHRLIDTNQVFGTEIIENFYNDEYEDYDYSV